MIRASNQKQIEMSQMKKLNRQSLSRPRTPTASSIQLYDILANEKVNATGGRQTPQLVLHTDKDSINVAMYIHQNTHVKSLANIRTHSNMFLHNVEEEAPSLAPKQPDIKAQHQARRCMTPRAHPVLSISGFGSVGWSMELVMGWGDWE